MDSLLRLSSLVFVVLFAVAAGCGRDRAGPAGLAGRTSIFRDGGGGSASCTQICNNLRRIDSADPECPIDVPPDCEAECEAQGDLGDVGGCLATAADCRALINCVDDGPDPPPPPPPTRVDAGSSGADAGSGGLCTDTCSLAGDGACDDGGEGSTTSACELGTDCTDCGER